jgi:hypothetical protein
MFNSIENSRPHSRDTVPMLRHTPWLPEQLAASLGRRLLRFRQFDFQLDDVFPAVIKVLDITVDDLADSTSPIRACFKGNLFDDMKCHHPFDNVSLVERIRFRCFHNNSLSSKQLVATATPLAAKRNDQSLATRVTRASSSLPLKIPQPSQRRCVSLWCSP